MESPSLTPEAKSALFTYLAYGISYWIASDLSWGFRSVLELAEVLLPMFAPMGLRVLENVPRGSTGQGKQLTVGEAVGESSRKFQGGAFT